LSVKIGVQFTDKFAITGKFRSSSTLAQLCCYNMTQMHCPDKDIFKIRYKFTNK